MTTIYKIHPGIGFARVGRSTDGYFIQGETLGDAPFELDQKGPVPFRGYKDKHNLIRRQGVRFRVYEYELDDVTGVSRLVREITPEVAVVSWEVKLANRKSAGPLMTGRAGPEGTTVIEPLSMTQFRNPVPAGGNRDDLTAKVDLTVTGVNTPPGPRQMGRVGGKDVFLGELETDHQGRLVVLGGEGRSGSWVNPAPELDDYLNNPGWYDDVADGPVDATLTFPGGAAPVPVDMGAWVVIGPPDFAPDVTPIVTLYDIMADRVGIGVPPAISFIQDVLPLLQRAASYHWVNRALEARWKKVRDGLASNLAALADPSDAADPVRLEMFEAVQKARELRELRFTTSQMEILKDWRDGAFLPGPDPTRPAPTEAELLDEGALARTVGGGFLPGIEAGYIMTYELYEERARVTRGDFRDFDGAMRRLQPGSLTERMAVPWQADFVECEKTWWPAQRPDVSRFDANGQALPNGTRWDRLVAVTDASGQLAHNRPSRANMVVHFAKLGIIEKRKIGGMEMFVETGRADDGDFPG